MKNKNLGEVQLQRGEVRRKLGKVPLERALSKLGLASRRETRGWVTAGRLKVNGRVVKDPLSPVVPEKDLFELDGKRLQQKQRRTILLYKPKGVVTTKSDERGRKTVFDVLPPEFKGLHPVGRLDMFSTGLLLLTNDTQLSAHLTDPANKIIRVYAVTVEGNFPPEKVRAAEKGVMDAGELLKPLKVTLRKASGKESHLVVELAEGKNREIRRLFASLGHEVTALKRVAFGPLALGQLQPGEFRIVDKSELKKGTGCFF